MVEIREGRNANWQDPPDAGAPAAEARVADPFAGVSDQELKGRLTAGSMAERRAAQNEMVRRRDAEHAAYTAQRQAELEKYAGDGTTWTPIPGRPIPTWQRGLHRVTVEVDLGGELDGFLADVSMILDRLDLHDLRPITIRVPARDRMFAGGLNRLTGGYVTEGLDFLNINPLVAKGLVEHLTEAQRLAQFMPGSAQGSLRQWILAHELGHIIDHGHGHTHDGKAAGSLFRKLKAGLSRYGKSHRSEGYAEAWAQWLIGGPGSSPVADAYAREYGWPGRK